MATISELVATYSKVPGDIRIVHCDHAGWFRPYYMSTESKYVHGPSQDDYSCKFHADDSGWELYAEPQPKVMRAQYAYFNAGNGVSIPTVSSYLFATDHEFLIIHGGPQLKWFRRLAEVECVE